MAWDDRWIASASNDKTAKVWDLATGRLLRTLEGHSDWVTGVAIAPNEHRVVSASHDGTLKVWDVRTGQLIRTLEGHSGWVQGVAVRPDGRRAVSVSSDRTIKLWDLETGNVQATFSCDGPVLCCAFVNDDVLIAGDATGHVHFLHLELGE